MHSIIENHEYNEYQDIEGHESLAHLSFLNAILLRNLKLLLKSKDIAFLWEAM